MTRYLRDKNRTRRQIHDDLASGKDAEEKPPIVDGGTAVRAPQPYLVYFYDYYRRAHEKGMTSLAEVEAREQWCHLLDLINQWDPIGLIALGCPDDEYECLAVEIMQMLDAGATAQHLAAEMAIHLPEHFGATVKRDGHGFFPAMIAWYHGRWRNLTE
ncbi:MAG: hypothetical protein FIB02_02585 [Desulfuromonas sp.]|nr:hypothetical protein [Desulfuromonas sp.]